MDGAGSDCLVHLCGTDVGNVIDRSIHLEAVVCSYGVKPGPPWRTYHRARRLAQNWNGQTRLAICIWLVLRCATVIAVGYIVEYECKPRAQSSGRIRAILQLLLEVLVVTYDTGRNGILAPRVFLPSNLAEPVDTKREAKCLRIDVFARD